MTGPRVIRPRFVRHLRRAAATEPQPDELAVDTRVDQMAGRGDLGARRTFARAPGQDPVEAGALLRRTDLARTLQAIADQSLQQRKEEIARCEQIIREKAALLLEHGRGLQGGVRVTPAFEHE